jgi:hypothetical protein
MILYITASSIWIYYSYTNAIYSLMLNAMIYIFIEIFGLIKWYKQYRSEVQAYKFESKEQHTTDIDGHPIIWKPVNKTRRK